MNPVQLLTKFKRFLENRRLSSSSKKNYLADLKKFLRFAETKIKQNSRVLKDSDFIFSLNNKLFLSYRMFLLNSNASPKTINRSLSSLRLFGKFLKKTKLSSKNPAENLANLLLSHYFPINNQQSTINNHNLLAQFKQDLLKEKLSPITIKNYLVDIKQFIEWKDQVF